MATSRVRVGSGSGGIRVEGLRELSKALAQIGDLKKDLRDTNKKVAETEAEHARGGAMSIGGVAAKSAPAIKASTGITSAGVAITAIGGYELGAAFGGQGRPTTMQFQPWVQGGYFPFPQIGQDSDDITSTYTEAINKLIERAFPH